MPDSTGFGDASPYGGAISMVDMSTPCIWMMIRPARGGGRELCGFPKKLASPVLRVELLPGLILLWSLVLWR